MKEKQEKGSKKLPKNKEASVNLAPLNFEQALENLLQVKPMPNEKSKTSNQKKKSKPKTKK